MILIREDFNSVPRTVRTIISAVPRTLIAVPDGAWKPEKLILIRTACRRHRTASYCVYTNHQQLETQYCYSSAFISKDTACRAVNNKKTISMTDTRTQKFSSEGFDLGALQDAADNVVLELGGGVSTTTTTATAATTTTTTTAIEDNETTGKTETAAASASPIALAEEWKQKGNHSFQQHDWLAAYDHYTAAIEATPGSPTGKEILQLQHEYEEEQNKAARKRFEEEEEAARRRKEKSGDVDNDDNNNNDDDDDDDEKTPPQSKPFRPPPHTYGTQLAVYHNNRAATCLQLASSVTDNDDAADDDDDQRRTARLEQAVQDCTIACLLNPTYTKAWIRRATAYERQDKTDLALADMKQAAVLDPTSKSIQHSVKRLQKLEDERLEKLKTETMDKLKDLGNSILGNFGLSLDNFNAVQDPNTGSYNISFSQNK